ncbi:SH3 domain-containing protein [Neobacillus sp. OS1-33]|uniref:SH3 domain-containing protein n=1 Tax=Neobacillus sp. OS1-33 TaxID=3070683 RepID=UPI0027E0A13C|nr:SH3 domain-containing protein [Neobacillus sp. OS1-33]WML24860.1 SH3 domain-containing protein [Neobacillus sp. OS1-33]
MGKVFVLSTGLLIGGLSSGMTIPLAPISIEHAEAASVVRLSKTTFQTTTNLRLRAGASTKYKTILTIPKGKVIYGTEKNGSYYKVTYAHKYKGKTYQKSGWVSGSYVKEYDQYIKTSGTYYFTKKTASLYSTPDTKKKVVGSLPVGNRLYSSQKVVNSIGKTWYQITYKGKSLYINSDDVSKSQLAPTKTPVNPPVSTSNGMYYLVLDDLNMRQSGEDSTILAVIPNGSSVKSTGKKLNDWYEVIYNGKTGYVYKSYIKEYKLTDYRFIDLRTQSTVTAKQINDYISKNINGKPSVLVNKGQAFIDAGKKYGVNALYLAAHAIHESGFGTSNISLGKKNLFGYGAYDAAPFVGAYRFSTVEQCINYVAQKMKADYLNPNGAHFEGALLGYRTNDSKGKRIASKSIGMNYWYASDPNWGNGIAQHMQKILAYEQKNYENASINNSVPTLPGIPAGKDKFPIGILAKAKKDLSSTIKKDKNFFLLEKFNDYNLKVNVNKQDATIKVPFSTYDDYFTVLNLGRVVGTGTDVLKVRPDASTTNKEIATLHLNEYVQLALDSKGNIIMDKEKNWYNIRLSNGKFGWVSKLYIARELK